MADITVWERIKEAIQALGGKGTYLEITEHILLKWPDTKPDTIRSEIIACTVNHHTRIHYKAKEPGISNKPYDFLFQPRRGIGYVEWYEPAKHGIWGNKRGEDGKLYVVRFDDEKGVRAPALAQFPQNVPSPRRAIKREVPPCPVSHGDRLARLIESLRSKLDLSEPLNPEEYAYQSLPLCVLDTVFSINAKYESTRNVVERYCRHYRLKQVRRDTLCLPPVEEQEPISAFVEKITNLGPEKFAGTVLANRQRTSTKSGIMKSEAALRFAQVLKLHKVEYFQDVEKIQGKEDFENAVKAIPGQRTGITVRYFYMLAGSDDFVKPDRMILGFLKDQLGERLSQDEAQKILSEVSNALKPEYPHLTTKTLDHHIWMYQREKGREKAKRTLTSKVAYASKQDVEMLKKLVVEFKSELDALGVKVDKLDIRQALLTEVPGLVRRDIPSSAESGGRWHDVFISHASEDKEEVVRPLVDALVVRGVDVWYDEFSLKIGDSLRQKIDQGLARSRIGLVVLSPSFLSKGWPQYELDGIVTRAVSGEQVLLPIWHNLTKQQVIDYSPSLADKVARSTATRTVEEIADEIAEVLRSIDNRVRTRSH